MSCIPWCCLECFYVMHYLLPFFIFMHLHLTSHLGTLNAPREGRDVGAKLEDGVWWTYSEDGRTLECSLEMFPKTVRANLT
jgi:hypothetical protein